MWGNQVLSTLSRCALRMHPRIYLQGVQPSRLSLSPPAARFYTPTFSARYWQQADCQFCSYAAAVCRTTGQLYQPRTFQRPSLGRKRSLLHTSVLCCAASKDVKPEDLVRRITRDDVEVSFARSSGAGGQNVNKVNTKVDMRLHLGKADFLSEEVRDALLRLEKNRINKDGEFVIQSQKTRSQADNIEDALIKMQAALDAAADSTIVKEVDPATKKKLAKQRKIANENRLDNKKKASMKKSDRRAKIDW